jgi:hypothetical protein
LPYVFSLPRLSYLTAEGFSQYRITYQVEPTHPGRNLKPSILPCCVPQPNLRIGGFRLFGRLRDREGEGTRIRRLEVVLEYDSRFLRCESRLSEFDSRLLAYDFPYE